MKTFKEYIKCSMIKNISDINEQYDYEDESPNGEGDSDLVACGQNGSYNELQYIYDEKLASFVDDKTITENEAFVALCKACQDLPNPRKREDFYKYLSDELGVAIN